VRGRAVHVHDGLVGARSLVGTPYLADPAMRAEYAREIAPRTEVALARVLAELYDGGRAWAAPPPRPARAIDLGAGTGAVGRALRARFGQELTLIEVDAASVAASGMARADLSTSLPAGVTRDGRFDLVVAAHLLNELFVEQAQDARIERRARRVLAWSAELLAPGGAMILIEPALRETSRELLAVRDRLAAAGLQIVAPCLRQGACPALEHARDWCHDSAPAGGARVDFSYLVLTSRPTASPAPGGWFRIVSDPLAEKGRLRLFGCGETGRQQIVRLDRHASSANAAFDETRRGDVLQIHEPDVARDGLRVTRDTVVRR
jgi:hypothetical protein